MPTDLQCIDLSTGEPVPAPCSSVLCLGNFDGVHLAHRALMKHAVTLRDKCFPQAACGVFCFREPSADFLIPNPPPHLCTREQKLERFRESGMEYAFLIPFPEIRNASPEQFIREILIAGCHAVAAVCGFNYRFGAKGTGTPETLRTLSGLPVSIQEEIVRDGETVSSTRIRSLLLNGQPEKAAELLTLPYSFRAPVLHGKTLGRRLGFPTVNQRFPEKMLIPKHGVYITECEVNGLRLRGVSNVGCHPTVDENATVNCETYLPGFSGNLYGAEMTVSFLRFLRPERKFNSEDELIMQIVADVSAALG